MAQSYAMACLFGDGLHWALPNVCKVSDLLQSARQPTNMRLHPLEARSP